MTLCIKPVMMSRTASSRRITQYTEAAARNLMKVDEALQGLDADTDLILDKRRWLLSKATGHQK